MIENYALSDGFLDNLEISADRNSVAFSLSAVPMTTSHPATQNTTLIRGHGILGDSDVRDLVLYFSGCKGLAVELNERASPDLYFDFPLSNTIEKFILTTSGANVWSADLRSEELHVCFEFTDVQVKETDESGN